MVLKKLFNKEKLKGMLIGSVITVLAVSPLLIFAGSEAITAYVSNIRVLINGEQLVSDKKPVIVNGTSMFSIRDIANAFNKNVSWDGETSTITITDKATPKPKPTRTPKPTPIVTPTPMPIDPELENYKVLRFTNGEKYIGQVKDNIPNGLGVYYYATNDKVSFGYWKDGKRNGYGISQQKGQSFMGEFRNNVANGAGAQIEANGRQTFGNYKDDLLCGNGAVFNGDIFYAGGFLNDERSGLGVVLLENGEFVGGHWLSGDISKITTGAVNTALENTPSQNSTSSVNNNATNNTNSISSNEEYVRTVKSQHEQKLSDIQTKISNTKNEKNVRILTSDGWQWTYDSNEVKKLEEQYQRELDSHERWKALWNIP